MRSVLLLLLLLVPVAVSNAQTINQKDSKGLKTGHWQNRYPNDTLKSEGYYSAGKTIGTWKYYYETGELMAIMEFLTDGTSNFKLFDASGPRIAEGLYNNGKKNGTWYYYGIDSSKVMDIVYSNGLKNGEEKVYFPKTGKLYQTTIFVKDKKEGTYKLFFDNGLLKTNGGFKDDKLDGKVIYYFPNGRKNMEGTYIKGLRDGEFYVYEESSGKLIETLHYKMGVLDEADQKRHNEAPIKKTYPEDAIYQGGYEQFNPHGGGENNGGY